jgi:inner membrane transporter RhtA
VRVLDRLPPIVLVLTAIVSLQFSSSVARTFFDQTTPIGATWLRAVLGAAILLAIVRPRLREWDRQTWLGVLWLGLSLAGMNSLIYLAFSEIPMGVAVTAEFLGPIAVALAQTRRVVDATWALLALAGVVLLGLDAFGGRLEPIGIVYSLLAAVCWAGYILASARLGARSRERGLEPLAVALAIVAIAVAPFGAAPGVHAVVEAPWLLLVFLAIAALTSALPYSLEFSALRRMPSRTFGILSSLGPAVAALAGAVVLREALSAVQLVALALVVAASIGVTLARRPRGRDVPRDA